MAMPNRTTAPAEELYQSQWWSRLAAISEMGERDEVPAVETKVKNPGFARVLSSLLDPVRNNRLITLEVKAS